MPFVANSKYYCVWAWKGEYWNLGTGAEIGIYYTDDPNQANNGYYDIDPDNLQLHVMMNVEYNHIPITEEFEQTNWWVTSFTPLKQMPKQDLIDVDILFSFASISPHTGLNSQFLPLVLNDYWDKVNVSVYNQDDDFDYQLIY